VPHAVTFPYKIVQAFARAIRKIAHDGEAYAVGGEFLQYVAGDTGLQIEEIGCYIFLVDDDAVVALEVQVAEQVGTVFGGGDEEVVRK